MGAALESDAYIMTLLIPVRRVELTVSMPAAESAEGADTLKAARSDLDSTDRESGHDVRGVREHEHR